MMASAGSLYFTLQSATSSTPITEGGPIGGYMFPSATGETFLATIALGSSTSAVKSKEESEEFIDSVRATASFTLLDLTLLPMEEESGERPDSALISETEGLEGRA
ncbi:hypothetical protein Bca52824_073306 [Brassica carinata]|uniref:Uncharacterized protein n=1 Tax=Brassica carinata TaxID=52824 RepID=A0A8X7QA11_BRACI|nr:hypothetical protein Bca52824_073306 [Brassica carinata]